MDTAVANALKEKKELEKRLAQVDQFLRLYDQFAGTKEGDADTHKKPAKTTVEPTQHRARARSASGRSAGPKAIIEAAAGVLKDFLRPLSRGNLAHELKKRGVKLHGKDKESQARYVGTILWRNQDRFENIEGEGYWLKGVPRGAKPGENDLTGKLSP